MHGKRIVILNNQGLDQRGGGVTMLRELIARLGPRNEIELWAYTQRPAADARDLPCVERVLSEPPPPRGPLWRLRPWLRARRLARDVPALLASADCVLCFDCHFAGALPRLRAAHRVYVSLSAQARQEDFDTRGLPGHRWRVWQYARLERAAIRAADLCVVSSAMHEEEIRRYERPRRFDPLVLSPAIPPPPAPPALDAVRGGELLALTVARLIPLKNVAAVLEVAARVKAAPLRFAVLGDGPLAGPLRRRAQELRLLQRVRFLDGSTDPAPWFAAAAFVLHPSRYESFGMAVFEGMYCGAVPIVPPRTRSFASAATELVEDGVSGLHGDFDAPEKVAAALDALALDPVRRAALSTAARDRAHTYCEPSWATRFEAALDALGT